MQNFEHENWENSPCDTVNLDWMAVLSCFLVWNCSTKVSPSPSRAQMAWPRGHRVEEQKIESELYWRSRKRSPKRLIVLVESKTGGSRLKIPVPCAWHVPPTFKFVPAPLDRPAYSHHHRLYCIKQYNYRPYSARQRLDNNRSSRL